MKWMLKNYEVIRMSKTEKAPRHNNINHGKAILGLKPLTPKSNIQCNATTKNICGQAHKNNSASV